MNTELLCAGVLAFLLFGLGLAVSVERGKAGKLGGVPADEATRLFRVIRAPGNAAEYIPVGVAFALFFAIAGSSVIVTAILVAFTASRIIHAVALIVGASMDRFDVARFLGGMGTYLTGFALSIALIARAI